MKQLLCEMCGSADLIKQDGVFVCQTCGCKYSVEEAKKMMVEGTVHVEGTVKIDNTDKLKTYKDMALNAYNSGNTSEAYQYFLKVLELDPSDYQSVFYKGMCQGWETTLANPRVGEAVHAYQIASEMIPAESIETATAVKESFIIDLTNLIDVWFTKARERYWDVEDWYSSNVSVFWDCLEVAEKVIEYIDNYKDFVLNSKSLELKKMVGQLYCDACYTMCVYIVQWTSYSKDSAVFPGLSVQMKQPYLKKYDDMIFEIRKYDPQFKKVVNKGYYLEGTINRLSPPTRIGPHNNVLTKQNNQECLRADKEIDKKVQKWKTEEARKIQEEKEKKYWKEHPEDEIKYKQLKSEYDIKLENMNKSQAAKSEAELLVNKCNEAISELNSELIKANAVIEKNQKKIFGKAKAQEVISQTRHAIEEIQKSIAVVEKNLIDANTKKDMAIKRYEEASDMLSAAKKEYDDFLRQCGL